MVFYDTVSYLYRVNHFMDGGGNHLGLYPTWSDCSVRKFFTSLAEDRGFSPGTPIFYITLEVNAVHS